MSEAVGETPQEPPVDVRAILAVIKTVAWNNSFVIPYKAVADALEKQADDYDDFLSLDAEFAAAAFGRRLDYIYGIHLQNMLADDDLIVVSPILLDEWRIKMLKDIGELFDYKFYGLEDDKTPETLADVQKRITLINVIINTLIRKWTHEATGYDNATPAMAVYMIAKRYGLDVRVVKIGPSVMIYRIDPRTNERETFQVSRVVYSIEDEVYVEKIGDETRGEWDWDFTSASEAQNNAQEASET
jgi:hypothetical protein